MDPDADPDPAIFVIDLQDANKKMSLKQKFPTYYFLKVHLHHFSKIKSPKEVTIRIKVFLTILLDDRRTIEGSGYESTALTNGSGSGSRRSKNMWIRIRIQNTAY
jgi:hypothetical protein